MEDIVGTPKMRRSQAPRCDERGTRGEVLAVVKSTDVMIARS
jgi:hypothetical protein